MKLNYVTIEKRGASATVGFDRKQNLNRFNEKLAIELTHIAQSVRDGLETRALVLSGAPEACYRRSLARI